MPSPPSPSRRALLAGIAATGASALLASAGATAARAELVTPTATRRAVIPSDRQGFNRRWFAPDLQSVYVPTRSTDVASCLEDAITRHGRDVKIVSGRHCYEDFAYNSSTRAIIDMSGIAQCGFDHERNAYFVDAGGDNWSAYRTLLNGYGRTLPDGSCASVGAGGHISGGGYGLLSREHGLSIDHVTAVDMVTWDDSTGRATLRHISDASTDAAERDLFWAVRGAGGGNFGVIVRFYFADPPVAPAYASLWTVNWNWDDIDQTRFTNLLDAYTDWVATMPGRQFSLLRLNHISAGAVGMTLQIASAPGASLADHLAQAGSVVTDAQRRLASAARIPTSMRAAGRSTSVRPGQQTVQHLTFLEALWTLNGSGPNQFGKYKSSYLRSAMPAQQVEALYDWLHRYPDGVPKAEMAQSLVQVDSYGGAINTYPSTSSAVPQRSSILKLQFQTYWNNDSPVGGGDQGRYEAQQRAHLDWLRGLYADTYAAYGGVPDPRMDPDGVVDGCYYNYPDSDLGTHADGRIEEALTLYFLDNYRANPRNLVAVKRRWDPANVFHHAQSIPAS